MGAHLKHRDDCMWKYEDADECPYCRLMARNEGNRRRVRRVVQFSEWLTRDGLELVFSVIGAIRDTRGGGKGSSSAGATNSSDDLPGEVGPHSVRSKSVSATSRGAMQEIDRANGSGSDLPKESGAGQPISAKGARKMDRKEKMRLRERIGEHLDVSSVRLKDDDAEFLAAFIDDYDAHRGQSQTKTRIFDGWSSDGKYTRREEYTDIFTDEVGIRQDYRYQDDDGQTGSSSSEIKDARGILNWFKDRG